MILFFFFLIVAGYLIIWGRIPIGWVTSKAAVSHPVLTRIPGVGLVALVLFADQLGSHPTLLLLSSVGLLLLLATSLLFGR